MRLLLLPLVLLALSTGPTPTPALAPTPTVAATTSVDIDAVADELHQQAVGALERLRQAGERRMAMAAPAAL